MDQTRFAGQSRYPRHSPTGDKVLLAGYPVAAQFARCIRRRISPIMDVGLHQYRARYPISLEALEERNAGGIEVGSRRRGEGLFSTDYFQRIASARSSSAAIELDSNDGSRGKSGVVPSSRTIFREREKGSLPPRLILMRETPRPVLIVVTWSLSPAILGSEFRVRAPQLKRTLYTRCCILVVVILLKKAHPLTRL